MTTELEHRLRIVALAKVAGGNPVAALDRAAEAAGFDPAHPEDRQAFLALYGGRIRELVLELLEEEVGGYGA